MFSSLVSRHRHISVTHLSWLMVSASKLESEKTFTHIKYWKIN